MSATASQCNKESQRLKRLTVPFGADKDGLIVECSKALQKHAKGDLHASLVVQHVIENMLECPMPAALIDLCRRVADGEAAPDGCAICHGEPWVHSMRIIKGIPHSFSGRCSCPRGRFLRAKEIEYGTVPGNPEAIR